MMYIYICYICRQRFYCIRRREYKIFFECSYASTIPSSLAWSDSITCYPQYLIVFFFFYYYFSLLFHFFVSSLEIIPSNFRLSSWRKEKEKNIPTLLLRFFLIFIIHLLWIWNKKKKIPAWVIIVKWIKILTFSLLIECFYSIIINSCF